MSNFTVPYSFSPGTQIKSSEFNENFTAIKNSLNSKALKQGDYNQTFEVADAISPNHAINKSQLETQISTIIQTSNINGVNYCIRIKLLRK